MTRHHVWDTQEQEALCAYLDELQHHADKSLLSVHCIPDVGGPHWFVIWKQHDHKAKGALGFTIPDREERHREAVPLGECLFETREDRSTGGTAAYAFCLTHQCVHPGSST